jgi:hypothetical protein
MPSTAEVHEQILTAVRKGQNVTLDALKVAVDRVAPVTARIPAVAIPTVTLPFADRVSDARGAVTPALDFAKKRIAEQRKSLAGQRKTAEKIFAEQREFARQLAGEQRKFAGEVKKTAAALRPAASESAAEGAPEIVTPLPETGIVTPLPETDAK